MASLLAWLLAGHGLARRAALRASRRACDEMGYQFLDETVALQRWRLRRDNGGRLRFLRCFRFEFSEQGADRGQGEVETLGDRVVGLRMDLADHSLVIDPQRRDRH
ncbi:MAG: DUF3301 domain-containing protein [Gammaproteobacteria bacterium]